MFITTFGFPKYVYHVSCSFLSNDFVGRGDFVLTVIGPCTEGTAMMIVIRQPLS